MVDVGAQIKEVVHKLDGIGDKYEALRDFVQRIAEVDMSDEDLYVTLDELVDVAKSILDRVDGVPT